MNKYKYDMVEIYLIKGCSNMTPPVIPPSARGGDIENNLFLIKYYYKSYCNYF